MKHMVRKPMLSLLLLAVMVFGTAFMAFFRADIAAGWAQIDRLYDDARITVEIVAESGWDNLQMKTHKSIMIEAMPEIGETLSVMECYYVLQDGEPLPEPAEGEEYVSAGTNIIHETNNLPWLTEYWEMTIQWHEGWGTENFRVADGSIPCLVRQEFLDLTGLQTGDVIAVTPTPWVGMVSVNAPEFEMTVVGVYEEEYGRTMSMDILVPEDTFLGEEVRLFYNSDMLYRCYYRAYALKLNPEFNREYDRVETELEDILFDLYGYSLATNARALENAARPLTQKLQMQELLVMPLAVLLCAAAVVIAVLLGMSMETEVFLRLMWGERRVAVFAALGGAVCLWLLVCVAVACGASWLTAGTEFVTWAAKYSAATAVLCAAGCAVPLLKSCTSNLVKFYQSREGE